MRQGASKKRHGWWLAPLLLVALGVAIVQLMSWNVVKPLIVERLEAASGRAVAIEGDIKVDLLPRPALSLHEVTIGNPQWAAAPQLLAAQRITVTPSLGDLLGGDVVLETLHMAAPTLTLEQRRDAPGNWVLQGAQESTAEPPPAADEPSAPPVAIRQFSVTDGEVRYLAAGADAPVAVTLSSLQIERDSGALDLAAAGRFRERGFELTAQTDAVEALLGGAAPFTGEVSLSTDDDRLDASVRLPEFPSLASLQADAELRLASTADWAQWLGLPGVALGPLELASRLVRDGSEWRLSEIDAAALDSHLSGEMAVDTAEPAPRLSGRLAITKIDLAAWREALPEGEDTSGMAIPVLPDLRGELALSVDQLALDQQELAEIKAKVHLDKHALALTPLRFAIAGGEVEASVDLTSSPDRLSAEAQVSLHTLAMQALGIALEAGDRAADDILAGDVALRLAPLTRRPAFARETLLANLQIDNGRFSYRNEEAGSDLDLAVATGEAPPLQLDLEGRFRDKPLAVEVEGGPLPDLVALNEAYPLAARARSGELQARVDTTLASLLNPATLSGDVRLQAPGADDLEAWTGPVLPALPAFRLAGRLARDGERWSATALEGEIAGSRIAGSVEFANAERPRVQADLDAGRIVLARLLPAGEGAGGKAAEGSRLAPLRGVDGQLALRAESLVLPDGTVLQRLDLDADLAEGRLEVDPLRFGLAGGSITSRLTMDATGEAAAGRLDAVIDDLSLTRLADTFTPVEDRLGRLSGNVQLTMSETLPVDRREELRLPLIGRMMVEPSTLRFANPQADTELTLTLETRGREAGDRQFHLQGEGRYDGDPATLSLVGDPLLDIRDPARPYALDLEAEVVGSRLALQGTLLRPLALKGLDLELALSGPDPQRLGRLLGIALPTLPRYAVAGDLALNDRRWTLDNLEGDIGDSDLDGRLSLDGGVRPPRLTGELHSDSLDIADLGVLIGATEQVQESDERFLLPDTPFIGEGWQAVAAEVSYRGESVRAGGVPLSEVVIDFRLEEGRGRFAPVRFGIGEGSVDLMLDLDATTVPPGGSMQVEVRRVDLNDVLRRWNLADDSVGIMGGRGKFWVEGRSVAELLASADGGVLVLMTGGRLDAMLVELAGLDAGQTFFSWLRGREPIPIECVYADLQARDGVTELDTFVIDTRDTTFTAGGEVDLNVERLDVSLFAHPKDPSVFTGRAPFHLGGTFDDIEASVHGGDLGMRVGASAALGAIGGPIAALLPLLEVGAGADMAHCEGLVSRSREAIRDEQGAP